ncbi:hypothetical protein D0T85_14565 [Bacteroides sp. 519]|nr:hypothetical protein [Bacteroides sp. 519]
MSRAVFQPGGTEAGRMPGKMYIQKQVCIFKTTLDPRKPLKRLIHAGYRWFCKTLSTPVLPHWQPVLYVVKCADMQVC